LDPFLVAAKSIYWYFCFLDDVDEEGDMQITRRAAAKFFAAGATAAVLPGSLLAQTPPVRMPLKDFVADTRLLTALRQGVAAMKARKPSDPLSWFYQAAIHGVTDQLICEQGSKDPLVFKVDRAKYWNQCPHKGENSANFLPWHRGYTYHFEQILRMHTGLADFALPYWDYAQPDQREFPRAFGIQHLDGNPTNDVPANINPLFHAERDYFLCGYEHPFTDQLPLTELSSRAVDVSRAMACPVFFGDTESNGVGGGIADSDSSTRGLLEQSPHDQIHRSVGGNVQGTDGDGNTSFAIGGMATPPTAGFDPIFPVHHANMDRLWARWSCMPGKSWGLLPDAAWFDERPWFFFDTSGKEVNRPRRDYFDREALGVRFRDDDASCKPLQLPTPTPTMTEMRNMAGASRLLSSQSLSASAPISASPTQPTAVPLVLAAEEAAPPNKSFGFDFRSLQASGERIVLTLHQVEIGRTGSTGFDVFLVKRGTDATSLRRDGASYLGPVSLFNHRSDGMLDIEQTFDLTAALGALDRTTLAGLDLLFVPYALTSAPKVSTLPVNLEARRLDAGGFTVTRMPRKEMMRITSGRHH
jgi:hypothetical protein